MRETQRSGSKPGGGCVTVYLKNRIGGGERATAASPTSETSVVTAAFTVSITDHHLFVVSYPSSLQIIYQHERRRHRERAFFGFIIRCSAARCRRRFSRRGDLWARVEDCADGARVLRESASSSGLSG